MIDPVMTAPALGALAQAYGPAERWAGARNWNTSWGVGGSVTWWIIVSTILVTLVAVLVILIQQRRQRERRSRLSFLADSDCMGLTDEERNLLSYVAKAAGVGSYETVFTMEAAFEQGMAALLRSEHVTSMSEEGRVYMSALLGSLRDKLGFHLADAQETMISSSRQIAQGARMSVVQRGEPNPFEVTVAQCTAMELVVEPEVYVETGRGELWLVRYCDGGSIWEFDAPVLRQRDGKVVLGHSEHVRFINRRRFPRIKVRREALVAPFPFSRTSHQHDTPEFLPATLAELAGPGLVLEAPIQLGVGERALVVMKMKQQRVIGGLGKVRRFTAGPSGMNVLAVELVGLNASEMAELVRETNAAAQEDKTESTAPARAAAAVAVQTASV